MEEKAYLSVHSVTPSPLRLEATMKKQLAKVNSFNNSIQSLIMMSKFDEMEENISRKNIKNSN